MQMDKKTDTLVVRIDGELDHHYATEIREKIDRTARNGIKRIIFDFTNLGFMDSSGIGVIMGRYKLMQSLGGDVCAFGISPNVDKLITMSGIKKIIKIYKSEKDALRGDQ